MIFPFQRLLHGALLALVVLASACRPEPAPEDALLYEVHPEFGSTLNSFHLLGTIHLGLSAEDIPPGVEEVIAASERVWLETNVRSVDQEVLLRASELPGGATNAELLDTDDWDLVQAALAPSLPPPLIEQLQPWLLSSIFSTPLLPPGASAEQLILTLSQNSTAFFLEFWLDQIEILNAVDYSEQAESLVELVRAPDAAAELSQQLVDAWRTGDGERIAALTAATQDNRPDFHQKVLVDRNINWIEESGFLWGTRGQEVVAVGAAHLYGDDGLIRLLEADGYGLIPVSWE